MRNCGEAAIDGRIRGTEASRECKGWRNASQGKREEGKLRRIWHQEVGVENMGQVSMSKTKSRKPAVRVKK